MSAAFETLFARALLDTGAANSRRHCRAERGSSGEPLCRLSQ